MKKVGFLCAFRFPTRSLFLCTRLNYSTHYTKKSPYNDIQREILQEAITLIDKKGFSKEAVVEAAESQGYSSAIVGMFESPQLDLLRYFLYQANQKSAEILQENSDKLNTMNMSSKLNFALKTRLSQNIPIMKHLHQAVGLLVVPTNIPVAIEELHTISDEILYNIGDKSSDLNWYTKRIAVGGIYSSSELFMISDQSKEFENTWDFVSNRVNDVQTAFQYKQALAETICSSTSLLLNFLPKRKD